MYRQQWQRHLKAYLETLFANLFSMKKAVPLINAIDTGRFPRLLSRILQKLHLKVCILVFLWLMTPLVPLKHAAIIWRTVRNIVL